MQPCATETQRTLTALLEAIESEAARAGAHSEDQRSERRRPLHADCELGLFNALGEPVIVRDALARNLTFLGLSVVVSMPDPVRIGRPVEAVVWAGDHARTYIAGTVAFCREVDNDCQEVGIAVKAAGSAPILMHDVHAARTVYEWFDAALNIPA